MDARRYLRDANEAGANAPDLNETFGECFTFQNVTEFLTFKAARPELFDGSPEDRRKAWIKFGQTSEGKSLRTR